MSAVDDQHPMYEESGGDATVGRDLESGDFAVAAAGHDSAASAGRLRGVISRIASFRPSMETVPDFDDVISFLFVSLYSLGIVSFVAYVIAERQLDYIENPYHRYFASTVLAASGFVVSCWLFTRALKAYYGRGGRVYVKTEAKRMCTTQDLDTLQGVFEDYPVTHVCEDWRCSICLGDCQDSDCQDSDCQQLRKLVICEHVFHRQCIDQWFLNRPFDSLSCPLCRASVFDAENAGFRK